MILVPPRRRMEAMTFTDSHQSILPMNDNEKAVRTTRIRSSTAHSKGGQAGQARMRRVSAIARLSHGYAYAQYREGGAR